MSITNDDGDSPGTDKENPAIPVRIPRVTCGFNCGTCGECGRILASDDEIDAVADDTTAR